MRGDVATDIDAYGTDFLAAHPDTSRVRIIALGVDTEASEQFDNYLLQFPDIFVDTQSICPEVEDGVADQLSRAVIGDAATATGRQDRDIFRRGNNILFAPETPHGVDVRVLEQQDSVWNFVFRS